jgi:Na+-transporting NADH:ubiquinone oxidoreductase subunit NqrB
MTPDRTSPVPSAGGVTAAGAPAQPQLRGKPAAAPRFDQRFVAPILVTVILLAGQLSYHILEDYRKTLLAIGTSIAVELILGRLFTGRWPHLASAYVSGISVGILIRSPEWWPYALCAAISITSKYAIRVKGRHIWNPSNLGIVAMLLLAHDTVATLGIQWGNSLAPMLIVWALGSFVVARLKRLHICATYVVAFAFFSLVRAAIAGQWWQGGGVTTLTAWNQYLAQVAPITGPMYQLFIFFMITDPKTTVTTRRAQIAVAVAIAFVEMILRLNHNIHAPYYALFLVGPAANLIEIWRNEREKARKAAATAAPSPAPTPVATTAPAG